ncbi:MAG: hypothetical protein JNM79_01695 [Burkholderiales bacterium]|nr:hypothetical protein [Burkholderiales bacterium]
MSAINLLPLVWRVAIVETRIRYAYAIGDSAEEARSYAHDQAQADRQAGGVLSSVVRDVRALTLEEAADFLAWKGRMEEAERRAGS